MGFQLGGSGGSVGRVVSAREALLGGGIALIVEAIELERGEDRRDVAPRRDHARFVGPLEHARHDQRGEDPEDHDDHEHFDQREAEVDRRATRRRVSFGDYNPRTPLASRRAPSRIRSLPPRVSNASLHRPRRSLLLHRRGVAATVALGWWFSRPLPLPSSPFVFEVRPGVSLKSVAQRTRRRRGPALRASARRARAVQASRPIDQGGQLRDCRRRHAAAPSRQADAGRCHAVGVDGRRRAARSPSSPQRSRRIPRS